MATFPTGKLLKNGFKIKTNNVIIRSDMESGPAKQAIQSSIGINQFSVEYFFSKSEFDIFKDWVKNTIGFVGTFDWIEPINNSVVSGKILSGDITDAEPINNQLSHWIVKFIIEVDEYALFALSTVLIDHSKRQLYSFDLQQTLEAPINKISPEFNTTRF